MKPMGSLRLWSVAKWVTLAGFLTVIAGLALQPDPALRFFWYVVVPLLPAVFLLNAELWRNVCPLATLNTLFADEEGMPLGPRASRVAAVVGVAGLLVAIPARVLFFNESGMATGALLAGAGVGALLSGIPFQRKAGFCNSVCPVLPVERLYGQSPLVGVANARCTPCHACTRAACYDLNPGRSALQILGSGASARPWSLQPFGIFALSFPGVIVGYALASGGTGVGAIVVGGAVSWICLALVFRLVDVTPAAGLRAAAALSAGLFYWFTPAAAGEALGLSGGAVTASRIAGLALVAIWTVRSMSDRRPPRRVWTLTRRDFATAGRRKP